MPQLNDLIKNREKKKFTKKSYRPWDFNANNSEVPINNQITNDKNNLLREEIFNSLKTEIDIQTHLEKDQDKENEQNLKSSKVTEAKNAYNIIDIDIDNKQITNKNLDTKLDSNKISNREQIDNKKATIREHLDIKLDNNFDPTSISNQLISLSGLQKNLLFLVVSICQEKQGLVTGPIDTKLVANHIQATYQTTKITINRLINKGFLLRQKGKTAKGGYIILELPKTIYDLIMEQKKLQKNTLHERQNFHSNQVGKQHQIDDVLDNKSTIYSSSSNKNTTTISDVWKKINCDPLEHIGFSEKQIKQLINLNTPEIVQESINHFAYALNYNEKYKKHPAPLNVIMGVLRKGEGWFENTYQSPQELAQQQLLKMKKEQLERVKKMEEEAYNLALTEWQECLSSIEIEQIIPNKKSPGDIIPKNVKLSTYFREHVWPLKRFEYLIN